MRRRSKGDVSWVLPNKKKPFAYSTVAAELLILAYPDNTIQEVYDLIAYDREAKGLLKVYIEHGYGSDLIKQHFR